MELQSTKFKKFCGKKKWLEIPADKRDSKEGIEASEEMMDEFMEFIGADSMTIHVRGHDSSFLGNQKVSPVEYLALYEQIQKKLIHIFDRGTLQGLAAAQDAHKCGDDGDGEAMEAIAEAMAYAMKDLPRSERNKMISSMKDRLKENGIGMDAFEVGKGGMSKLTKNDNDDDEDKLLNDLTS